MPGAVGLPAFRAGVAAAFAAVLGLTAGFAVCDFAAPADVALVAAAAAGFAITFGAGGGGMTNGRAGLSG